MDTEEQWTFMSALSHDVRTRFFTQVSGLDFDPDADRIAIQFQEGKVTPDQEQGILCDVATEFGIDPGILEPGGYVVEKNL